MSKLKFLIYFLMIYFCSSCSRYYQVMETSSTNTTVENNAFVFENSEIKITYNFWEDGGVMNFILSNKTDSSIFIDWNKSHMIFNDISYEYWNDAEESEAFYTSYSTTSSSSFVDALSNFKLRNTYGNSISTTSQGKKSGVISSSKYKPKKILHIPPKSGILVSKFSLTKDPFFNCDFNMSKLNGKSPKSKSFQKNDSPLKFRNYLTYSNNETFLKTRTIDNEFYISQALFMKENVFFGKSITEKECDINGNKKNQTKSTYPFKKSNNFFIKL